MKRLVIAVSGASGLLLGKSLLECLHSPETQAGGVEIHLIISSAARQVAAFEAGHARETLASMEHMAHAVYDPGDFSAPMASGSWRHSGMVICPCSMSSLAAIATGNGRHLIHRAADVCLKEKRPLVLVPRETPLSRIHLRNMLAANDAGAIIMPPNIAYYTGPDSIETAARHFSTRILDQLDIPGPSISRWGEEEGVY